MIWAPGTAIAIFCVTLVYAIWRYIVLLYENVTLEKVNDALSKQNQLLVQHVRNQQVQLTAHINTTESVLQERNTVWQFYRDSALMSGSAQDIMMGEIKRLIMKLPGERLHPALAQVAKDYIDQHVNNDALPSDRRS